MRLVWGVRPLRVGGLLAVLTVIGCGFPDYTYVDGFGDAATGGTGGSGGSGGTSGTGGTGATGGSSGIGGTAGDDAGDGPLDAIDEDVSADAADAPDEISTDVVEASDDADAAEADAPEEADAQQEADAPADGPDACVPVAENCTNGKDDDCDGLVDCEDTDDCSAIVKCVPPVPAGWTGYATLWEGAPASLPSCPQLFPAVSLVLGGQTQGAPATCSSCSCGAATNIACGGDVVVHQSASCSTSGWALASPVGPNSCTYSEFAPLSGMPNTPPAAVTLSQEELLSGECPVSGGTPTTAPASWSTRAKVCEGAPAAGGCPANPIQQACVPIPKGVGFLSGVCIYKQGIAACPQPFFDHHEYYDSWVDTRGCSACSCGAPVVTCNGTLDTSTVACAGQPGAVAQAHSTLGECTALSSPLSGPSPWTYFFKYTPGTPTVGSCSPSTSQPMGDVVGDSTHAYTFCCF